MNIDLLPFSGFALESSAGASNSLGESHTLTLRLGLAPVAPAMDGSIGFTDQLAQGPALRATVVPVPGPILTITF